MTHTNATFARWFAELRRRKLVRVALALRPRGLATHCNVACARARLVAIAHAPGTG